MLLRTIWIITVIFTGLSVHAQVQQRLAYIEKYQDIAIREMERAGIPASIKLAQAILESDGGNSFLAQRANNHFGIKCGDNWNGKKVYRKDDDYDEKGKLIESCFRAYKNVDASYIAHSEFLRDPKKIERYGFLFRLDPTDYRRWAYGLKQAGYATSANYHRKLIDIIETYELYKLDQLSSLDLIASTDAITGILINNDVKYALSAPDETLTDIARRTDTTLRSLLKYNEMINDPGQELEEGTKIYLQPKRRSFRGKKTWHYVKEGETMYEISQLYGVKLRRLFKRNRIPKDDQPAVGERLKLRGCKIKEQPVLASEARYKPEAPMPELIIDEEEEDDRLEMDTSEEIVPEEEERPAPIRENKPDPEEEEEEDSVEVLPPITPQKPDAKPEEKPESEMPVPVKNNEEEQVEEDPFTDPLGEPPIPEKESPIYHTVARGDTLWNISQRYETTVDKIKQLNGLNSNNIQIGTRLRVK